MDVVNAAYGGAASGSSLAPVLAFAAGAASSFGPCVGPRMLAVAALCARRRGTGRWIATCIFCVGLCGGYAVIGTVAGAAGLASAFSPWIFRVLAGLAIIAGIATLASKSTAHFCEWKVGHGAGFFAGLASATVASPCCAPLGVALAGVAAASEGPQFAAAVVASFALGHVVPLAAIAAFSPRATGRIARFLANGAGATISGALMLAAGGYYAVIA
jgi:thiol:disulfide interchange protein DsbD